MSAILVNERWHNIGCSFELKWWLTVDLIHAVASQDIIPSQNMKKTIKKWAFQRQIFLLFCFVASFSTKHDYTFHMHKNMCIWVRIITMVFDCSERLREIITCHVQQQSINWGQDSPLAQTSVCHWVCFVLVYWLLRDSQWNDTSCYNNKSKWVHRQSWQCFYCATRQWQIAKAGHRRLRPA